jgi:hypothetical protein
MVQCRLWNTLTFRIMWGNSCGKSFSIHLMYCAVLFPRKSQLMHIYAFIF